MNLSYVTNIFDLYVFDNETTALLNVFEICTETYFAYLFFLNERNISTSLLMMHLKCTAAHYGSLNSSAIKQAVFKLRAVEYAISFYRFLIYIN